VIVGQVDRREQVEALIAPGQLPAIFQVSHETGPYTSCESLDVFRDCAGVPRRR
jgi:hypothetical protein